METKEWIEIINCDSENYIYLTVVFTLKGGIEFNKNTSYL